MTKMERQVYDRTRYLVNRERIRARNKKWAEEHPEEMRAMRRRSSKKKRGLVHQAHVAVYAALRMGHLTKPDRCQACGETRDIQAHHHMGYAREHRLTVTWLCRTCHIRVHHHRNGDKRIVSWIEKA